MQRLGANNDSIGQLEKKFLPAVVPYLPSDNFGEVAASRQDVSSEESSAHDCLKLLPLKEALGLLGPELPRQTPCSSLWIVCKRICVCLQCAWLCRCCPCLCRRRHQQPEGAREVPGEPPKDEDEERRLVFREER